MKSNFWSNHLTKRETKTIIIWFIIVALILSACKAQYHFQKFQQKGGKINCVSDTIQVLDTIVINGDTIYQWRPQIVVKDSIHYLTRFEVKYRYLTDKSNNKLEEKKAKEETKQNKSDNNLEEAKNKNDNKTEAKIQKAKSIPWYVWLIIGWLIGLLTMVVVWVVYLVNVGRKMPFK